MLEPSLPGVVTVGDVPLGPVELLILEITQAGRRMCPVRNVSRAMPSRFGRRYAFRTFGTGCIARPAGTSRLCIASRVALPPKKKRGPKAPFRFPQNPSWLRRVKGIQP